MAGTSHRRLEDGRSVVLREADAGDTLAIAQLFMELSPPSFVSRFLVSRPGPDQVAQLAVFDQSCGTVCVVAAMAEDPGRLAAEARYVPVDDGVAEVGLTVLDGYQGAGLGRLLLGTLVRHARESGLERLRAIVSLANGPMLHLLEPFGWVLTEPADGTACLEISVVGGTPGWPAATTARRVLVEQRGWFDDERAAALRAAGCDVRRCAGPRRSTGRVCSLLAAGHCRLAEEADLIVPLLPEDDADCAAVLDAHRRRWAFRLAW